MNIRILSVCALALAASCGDTTDTGVTQLDFERPVDVAFACYGGLRITHGNPALPDDQITVSAQPLTSCDARSGEHESGTPTPTPIGQDDLTTIGGAPIPATAWYAFILQSAPGTVAIASWVTKPAVAFAGGDITVLDADPLTPGKNGISVGEDPVAISTDKAGCYEVIANAGSCDLSALDIGTALDTEPDVRVNRMPVTNAMGQTILARPAAMAGEPSGGTIGETCSANPSGLVYVAYPGCHLVAAIDSSNGRIVKGIDYSSGTPTLTDGNVSCPAECGGSGAVTAGIRPVALDLQADQNSDTVKLVIGADNSSALTIVELGSDALPLSMRQVSFDDPTGTLGFTAVTLSPTIGMGGHDGILNDTLTSNKFEFVYGVATDKTVRVADIYALNHECDTQVDPRMIDTDTDVAQLSCFRVGDVATPRRRPGARGPGIELPNNAIPTSVATFKSQELDPDTRATGPAKLVGYFAVITAANGGSYVVNIDDDDYPDFKVGSTPLGVAMPKAIAHQLRDALPNRDALPQNVDDNNQTQPLCDDNGPDPDTSAGNSAGPRSTGAPTRNVPAGTFAAEKVGELPAIRQVSCVGLDEPAGKPVSELSYPAPELTRDLEYPDLRALPLDQTYTLTWEGSLSIDQGNSDVDGPPIRVGQMQVDNQGFRMVDPSNAFCDAGVEQFDVLQLDGCDPSVGDAECPVGYTCFVHPNSQVAGIGACMLVDEADRLSTACRDFLTSTRRYTVNRAESGLVTLLPRKHELTTTPLDGCTDDTQCQSLADLAAQNITSADPVNATAKDSHKYVCATDNDRAPLDGTNKRCIESCTQTTDCTTGHICQAGFCMEGVEPPQACVNGPQRFELRAGEAFTLVGTRSGYVHHRILDTTSGKCIDDPKASPFEVGRLKLNAPACDPAADPRTGLKPDGSYDVNPCSLTVDHTELQPVYVAGSCTFDSPSTKLVTRQAPAVRIHTPGPTITLVDPYYPGDARCIRDMGGSLGKIPMVFAGYQLTWRQTAGFAPLTLPLSPGPAFPVRVLRGPQNSVWVVDDGDYLSTTITLPSTRGKVYRTEIQNVGPVNLLE